MLPLAPTLVLAFVSFASSAFVVLRIVIPILPPHPLSRRVPPSEFGLPNFRTLSPADKSHIWLASCDIAALAIFVWQAISEHLGGPTGYGIANDPGSAVRLWIATTLRQSCLLVVAGLTLAHVRLGQPVALGAKHWMLWCPTLLLTITSTVLAGVLASSGVQSFFWGLLGYSASMAVMSSIAFGCLIGTLVIIRRNLATLNDMRDLWPQAAVTEEKPRHQSFATDDINALKDGSSWITSRPSSRAESISAFSFSTHHTQHSRMPSNASSRSPVHPNITSHTSIPAKSPFWFGNGTPLNGRVSPIPPVPPLPAPYRPRNSTYNAHDDPDPFHRVDPRIRMGSQSSWLSESTGWQNEPSLSHWSFSTANHSTHHSYGSPSPYPSSPVSHQQLLTAELPPTSTAVSRPPTPATVLGGYGYAPDASKAETSGVSQPVKPDNEVDVSTCRAIGWLITVWLPMGLTIPYYVTSQLAEPSAAAAFLMVLSVTMSAPLLMANILFRSPLPIPSGLFDTPSEPPSVVFRAPSSISSQASEPVVRESKRSGSTTVVEGRRSGDVWITNGDAVDGRTKVARALTLLQPKPKLSVLPPQEEIRDRAFSPPLLIKDVGAMSTVPPTPQSHSPAELGLNREMGTRKKDSKASSYYSGTDESVAFATKIMIAQRHYSALAMTINVPPSPKRKMPQDIAATTAVQVEAVRTPETKRHSHLRARSITSVSSIPRDAISPPPSTPLPPTPPALRNFKAASAAKRLAHRKSYSSTAEEFSFGPIESDNTREIDALSAGLLPLLVPSIKVGEDMKITDGWKMSPTIMSMKEKARKNRVPSELGSMSADLSLPQFQSTPQNRMAQTQPRGRKISAHKKNQFSLPSLTLGKNGLQPLSIWRGDVSHALDNKLEGYDSIDSSVPEIRMENNRRATVDGGESAEQYLKAVTEEDESSRPGSPGSMLDVPEGIDTSRNSLLTLISALDQEINLLPPSATSEVTLFDFNPGTDGVFESTPHESKTQPSYKRHSRYFEAPPPMPDLPQSARRSSIVYIESDEDTAALPPPPTVDVSGRTSPVVRPLAPRTKASKHRQKKPSVNQENVTPQVDVRGLRQLSLLQDREQEPVSPPTKPLAIGKSTKKAQKEKEKDSESIRSRESPLKRALRPLRLVRSETAKQRAVLREREVLPDVIIRPPSDGQHIGFQFSFDR